MRKLGRLFCWVAVFSWACALGISRAEGTKFDSPPTISSRKVVLTWSAGDSTLDIPDPYFSGNAVIKRDGQWTLAHQAGHAVRFLVPELGATQAYSWAEGEAAIRHWALSGAGPGVAPDNLDVSGLTLRDVQLHSSEAFLLAALSGPEVVLWALRRGDPHAVLDSVPSPILALRFLPAALDTTSLRFVAVSVDDSVRVFRRPGGDVLAVSRVTGGASGALALVPRPASNDFIIGAGTKGGRVRIWNSIALGTANMILGDQNPHPAPVKQIAFSPDSRRLASADSLGEVRIWSLADGSLLGSFQTGYPSPFIAFTPPRGALLLVGVGNGEVRVHNGTDGSFYRGENYVNRTLTAMALSPGGGRLILGDANGVVTAVQAGFCRASATQPRCFGGYMVWRSPTPDPADKKLLRIYAFGDSTWNFTTRTRSFCDPESIIARTSLPIPGREDLQEEIVIPGPHNGVPYYYSVTRFDNVYLSQASFAELQSAIEGQDAVYAGFYRDPGETDPTPIIPRAAARTQTPLLSEVRVVPNPYQKGLSGWELPGEMHVEFQNLPSYATVRIYTVGGDFVRELDHGLDQYGRTTSTLKWDLKNSSGRWVAAGVYIYQVKTPSGEVDQGYFTVIL